MNELIAEGEDINFIDNPNLDALEWSQKAIAMLRQQQAEIEVLKQQLVTTSSEAKLNYNKGHEDGRKLAVVKQITDEEILISAQYNGIRASEILDEYVIEFARAILRKASEK